MTNKVVGADTTTVFGTSKFKDWLEAYNYLVGFLNQVREKHDLLVDAIGSNDDLTTADKSSLVSAINEVAAIANSVAGFSDKVGDLTQLKTSDKSDAVAAINELYDAIGLPLSNLAGSAANVIEAINNLSSSVGALSSLATTDKSSLVAAINEVVSGMAAFVSAEYATQAETDAGTEAAKAVSPATLAGLGDGAAADGIRTAVLRGQKAVYAGSVDPAASLGVDGDVYVKTDGAAGTYVIKIKDSGAWVDAEDLDQHVLVGNGAPPAVLGDEHDIWIRQDAPGGIYVKTASGWDGPLPGSVEQQIPTSVTDLSDTPANYAGQAGKHLAVKAAEDGVEFVDPVTTWSDLGDTPASYAGQAGKIPAVKATEDGLEFVSMITGFSGLVDTPADYSGHAGKHVTVKATEDGLEFTSVDHRFIAMTDTPATFAGFAGKYLRVTATEDSVEFADPPAGIDQLINLIDTPASYASQAGKFLVVKSTEDGIEFVPAPSDGGGGGATNWVDLLDTPSSYAGQAGKVVMVKADESGLEFGTTSGSGSATWLGLTDTPSSFAGQGGKYVRVNATEDGLEFAASAGGATVWTDLGDTPAGYSGQAGKVPSVKTTEDGLEFVTPVSDLVDLGDTPASYVGNAGKHLAVNATENGVEFVDPPSGGGASNWTDLGDTPASYAGQGGQLVAVKATEDGLEFVAPASGGGASTFTDLTDTPANYSGFADYYVKVKADESGLEFVTAPSGGGASNWTDLNDTPVSYTGQAGKVPSVKATEDGLEFVSVPSAWTDLTDTPTSFAGQGGQLVAVKATEDGLEFVAPSSGGGASAFTDLTDTPANYTGQAGQMVVVNSTEDGLEFATPPSGGGSSSTIPVENKTAAYTLASGDEGKYIRMSTTLGTTVTVPDNATVGFAIGTVIEIRQANSGSVTIVGGAGVTVNTAETMRTRKRGSTLSLIKVATDEWDIAGDVMPLFGMDCSNDGLKQLAPNAHFMFRPDDPGLITVDGSNNITAATDAFGLNDMSSTNGPAYTNQINSLNVATFAGDNLEIPWDTTVTEFTVAIVFTTTDTDTASNWWDSPMLFGREISGSVNDFGVVINNGKISFVAGPSSGQNDGAATINDGNPHVVVVRWKTDGTFDVRVDGSPDASGTTGTGARDAMTEVYFGNTVNNAFNGDVAQGALWKYYAADTEIEQIEGHLAHKWGITLPSTHRYATTSPCA